MADVTRYIVDEWWPVEGAERAQDGQLIVIAEADYLAALERVRVETLREARAAVWLEMPVGCQLAPISSCPNCRESKATVRFLDRLINAATTGPTQ